MKTKKRGRPRRVDSVERAGFNIPTDLMRWMRRHSQETGRPMSRIVEDLIRAKRAS